MTDEEIICTFMEPKPDGFTSDISWWRWGWTLDPMDSVACTLDLDALHEVEARLTDEQWVVYEGHLLYVILAGFEDGPSENRFLLHASAEQKIQALAAVLRTSEPRS